MFTGTIRSLRPTLTVERLEDRLVPNRLDFGLGLDVGWDLPFDLFAQTKPHPAPLLAILEETHTPAASRSVAAIQTPARRNKNPARVQGPRP